MDLIEANQARRVCCRRWDRRVTAPADAGHTHAPIRAMAMPPPLTPTPALIPSRQTYAYVSI
jgi:hypothetical protein